MKIAIIIGCLRFGGAERVAVNIAKWFYNKGNEVSFFLTKQQTQEEYQIPEAIIKRYCYHKNNILMVLKMRREISAYKPDVALVMGTPMCVYAIPALFALRIPIVVSERSAPNNARIKKITRKASFQLMKIADSFVFQTNGARACFSGKIQKRGCVIPNPIILADLPNMYEGIRNKRVVAVGRLVIEKNYPMLLHAFFEFHKTHPEYTLDIYGDGPERAHLDSLIKELDLEKYVCLNHSRPDVLEAIKDAEIFVLTSDLEGMPNALIEGMALGLACISTDCPSGGPADLIQDGVDGCLVPVNDSEALAEKLCYLADHGALRVDMGRKASNVRQRLNIDVVGEKWKSVFINAIMRKSE